MAVQSSSYDVLLSFRGSDIRHGFAGYLHKALCDKGIRTFFDDEKLQREEEITPSHVKEIQESRSAIIVLSKDYASSSFCLDELATIMDCMSEELLVIPVFYKVDPSDVRHQRGSYGEALAEHEKRLNHNMDKLQKWRMALTKVANISGYHLDQRELEYEFIETVVASIINIINLPIINRPDPLPVTDHPVGLESQVAEVMKLLDVGSDDGVHIIGIYGMGGVGKSTLARAVYNKLIYENFDGLCFLENVREASNKHGLEHLQRELLQQILREEEIKVESVGQGSLMIKHILQQKKVFLALDHVDNDEQLNAIVGRPNLFGPGSRVIIITRDKQLLESYAVKRIYEVNKLNEKDALQLLKWNAFKTQDVDPRYEEYLNAVVTLASGNPLALQVIGSYLFGRSVEEWESAINKLSRPDHYEIQDVLKVSFDGLEAEEKSVFLDIACCFNGYELAEVQDILGAHYGRCMKHSIAVLVDKSLVKLSHSIKPCYDTFTLHDLIVKMGKEIDRQESPERPNRRRRLWFPEDILEVLKDNLGTSNIEIICMDSPIFDDMGIIEWDGKAFQNMPNLKTLIIRNGTFSKGPGYLPNSLKVLEWWRYPSHCLPPDFNPKQLAICKLPRSRISTIELTDLLKKFVNLRVLKFSRANV